PLARAEKACKPGVKGQHDAALPRQLSAMKALRPTLAIIAAFTALTATAQVVLTGTAYTQDFNAIGSGLPDGWDVRTGATSASLGTTASFTSSATSWGTSTGSFRNAASTSGLNSSSSATDQSNSGDRALAVRQTAAFGDPGAAFVFNFNSTGFNLTSLSLDALMLSVQGYSTTWTLDYGIGASPTAFTSLTTYTDPSAWGATPLSITGSALASMSNQASVWIRVVALSSATGSSSRDTFGIDNFSLTYTAVPEPSTYALLAGLVALAGAMLRRRFRPGVNAS
ncbi:MAG: PEP-CTERM sorting domain-containing protein, partial [Opitutaceae bacterium]|nr:PEP-CTERM sorting domain-containing protein [Opitutaceae bacterium]